MGGLAGKIIGLGSITLQEVPYILLGGLNAWRLGGEGKDEGEKGWKVEVGMRKAEKKKVGKMQG